MSRHLRYYLHYHIIKGFEDCPKKHPEDVMKDLCISYQYGIPKPIGDQWWFLNCENLPDTLPPYLETLDVDINFEELHKCGLNEEEIRKVLTYSNKL